MKVSLHFGGIKAVIIPELESEWKVLPMPMDLIHDDPPHQYEMMLLVKSHEALTALLIQLNERIEAI
jgi:hypothetical protein